MRVQVCDNLLIAERTLYMPQEKLRAIDRSALILIASSLVLVRAVVRKVMSKMWAKNARRREVLQDLWRANGR